MIVVLVKYVCFPNLRETFLHGLKESGIGNSSRSENGNVRYEYSLSADDENALLLTEIWRDTQSLFFHASTPHYKELCELKKQYVEQTLIQKYEANLL